MSKIENILNNLARRNERLLQVAIREWFDFTQKQIKRDISAKFEKVKRDITTRLTDWEIIEAQGVRTIKPASLEIMRTGGNAAYKHLAIEGSFDVLNVRTVKAVEKFTAKLVREVTDNTRKGIRSYIKYGIKEGYSMPKIARELKPLVGLTAKQTQATINYRALLATRRPDLIASQLDKATLKYTNKLHRQRVLTIARTETARAQNIGYNQGLEEIGIKEVEFRVSPADFCPECEALDGTVFNVKEGAGIIPVHPNCRCAMLPVINDRVISERLKSPPKRL